eukprot:CAMPEP_0181426784 /NCGR_PEP_ID=MMETSP1110-20121109/15837_1 /TAXON_ID=174948 /ORGANISM="Symbiodinium sp., Strain CCMP421" /LENGTH=606 /DNA_ID=CAMNT_0023549981 /DNA_START=96 /DNA_END=1916 /DNA_ORIENTATION=+
MSRSMQDLRSKDPFCGQPAWQFSALFEDARVEKDPASLCGCYVAVFHFKVICHERPRSNKMYAGCTEYSWSISRRFSEFQSLDAALRELLPELPQLPKASWRPFCPSEEFVKQRAGQLFEYLTAVLAKAAQKATEEPLKFADAVDVCDNLPLFLGLQHKEQKGEVGRGWALPKIEGRPAALVHSLDRGIFVYGHLEAGTQLTKYDRQAALGNLTCTHAEVRPCKGAARSQDVRRGCASPLAQPETSSFGNWSEASSPLPSPLRSPVRSPAESRATSPRRRAFSSDESSSASTADTKTSITFEMIVDEVPVPKPPSPCVWMEVQLDNEALALNEHRQWWAWARAKRAGEEDSALPMPTSAAVKAQFDKDKDKERRRILERYECVAAMWRELSVENEVLNTILGYGVEGRTLVLAHQAAPTFRGLRELSFRKDRCHMLLTQTLQALVYLHSQGVPHGHLCPESFLMDGEQLEKRVRLIWTPGQKRSEGRMPTTLGFKGPGDEPSAAGDIWSFACVLLVWYFNFSPVSHPWFQFAKRQQLKQAIQEALASKQPELPQALLELHGAVAAADESDTHVALAAQVCTRCLQWAPESRPSALELQQEVAQATV